MNCGSPHSCWLCLQFVFAAGPYGVRPIPACDGNTYTDAEKWEFTSKYIAFSSPPRNVGKISVFRLFKAVTIIGSICLQILLDLEVGKLW